MAPLLSLTALGSQVLIVLKDDIWSHWPEGAGLFFSSSFFLLFSILSLSFLTLPKLPLPSTIRKLKSCIPILTLAGPMLCTGAQGSTVVGVTAVGKDSHSGTGRTGCGREGVVVPSG